MNDGKHRRMDLATLMRDLEAGYRSCMNSPPGERVPPEGWPAVMYRAGTLTCITPIGQVSELLDLPPAITPVPGAAAALRGIINHRGALLPVYDLARLAGSAQQQSARVLSVRGRILVVRLRRAHCGLLVSRVIGKRYIVETDRCDEDIVACKAIQAFVTGIYRIEDQPTAAVDLVQLVASLLTAATYIDQAAPHAGH